MAEKTLIQYHEIQVQHSPLDTKWRTHYQGDCEEVSMYWDLNDQLRSIPDQYKRVVEIAHTITTEVIELPEGKQ